MISHILTFFIGSTLGALTMAFVAGATRKEKELEGDK